MESTEDIKKLREIFLSNYQIINELSIISDKWLQEIFSFLKWTAALSLGIIAWAATKQYPIPILGKIIQIFGLIFIFISFSFSIWIMKEILEFSEYTQKAVERFAQVKFFLFADKIDLKDINSKIDEVKNYSKKRTEWLNNEKIGWYVTIHLIFLLIGTSLYAVSMLV